MPQIRDWTFNYVTSTTATSITCPCPSYEQNDLLLAILSTDTGTQTWTSTGWTQLFSVTNTCNLGVMWKIATSSEPVEFTFNYTTAETSNAYIISIKDVNTSSPFNGTGGAGTGYRTANNTAARAAMPILTTTVENSLIIWINTDSGIVVPGILEGPCTFESAADGSAHSKGFSWGFKPIPGASPPASADKSGTAAGILATIGISPPATGASIIPTYCAEDLSIYIDPIHGTTAFDGNGAFSNTVTTYFGTSIGGRTLSNGTVGAAADVGLNSYHSMGQLTGVTTNGTWAGSVITRAAGKYINATGKNIICHIKPQTPKILQTTDPITKSTTKGIAIGLCSTANSNFKVWHVHGANTAWNSAQHVPVIVNPSATAGLIQTTGTLDDTSILAFGFFCSGFVVAPVWQFGSMWVLDYTTICGGNQNFPVNISGIFKVLSLGKERMSSIQQGSSQILLMQPVQFGNGGTNPIYLDLDSTAIEFPQQYNLKDKQVFYNSIDNAVGIRYYAGPQDTIKHTNSVISSKNKFKWEFHASSSPSAAYDFSGTSIIGAGIVTLNQNIPLNYVTFSKCDEISFPGNILSNCIFKESNGISTQGALKLTSNTQNGLQTLLDKLINCTFSNNINPSGAIKLEYTGTAGPITLNFSGGCKFEGNINDIYWSAPAGSSLTLNLSNGTNPTTYSATNSNTVTFVQTNNFYITNIPPSAEVRIFKTSDSSQLCGVENIGFSTPENCLISLDSENPGKYKLQYSHSETSLPVYIVIIHLNYQAYRQDYILTNDTQNLLVSLIQDRQYQNI